jgi:AhpD family alkylhydroperoxidase
MTEPIYPPPSAKTATRRRRLAPAIHDAFEAFSKQVFADGALDPKTKQLIAVAVAHVTQCPYCIQAHTRAALRTGATEAQLIEAIWVAAEMRAGGAYAHSTLALETIRRARRDGHHSDPATPHADASDDTSRRPAVDEPGPVTRNQPSTTRHEGVQR